MQLHLEQPEQRHERGFLAAAARSARLHRPWVSPPRDRSAYRSWLARTRDERHASWLIVASAHESKEDGSDLVGVVNANEIVRGAFQSAYLGYYAFVPHAGRGAMKRGLALALRACFRDLRLHRVEANVQPGNEASIALVRGLGFRLEGVSPRYLKIGGRWRDHERWALLAEEFRRPRGEGASRRGR